MSPVSDLPAGWLYLEQRRVVVDPSRGVVATVNGTTADGVMLAGAQRLFAALVALEQSAGAVAEDRRLFRQGARGVFSVAPSARD